MTTPIASVEGVVDGAQALVNKTKGMQPDLEVNLASTPRAEKVSGSAFWETKLVGASEGLTKDFKDFMSASKKINSGSATNPKDVIESINKATDASREITKFQIKFSLVNGLVTAATGSLKQMLKT